MSSYNYKNIIFRIIYKHSKPGIHICCLTVDFSRTLWFASQNSESFSFADAICRKSPSSITRLIRLFLRNFSCVSIPDISISTSDCNWFIFSFLADSLSRIPVKRSAAITGTAMHMVTRKSLTFRDIRSFNFGNSCKINSMVHCLFTLYHEFEMFSYSN